MKKLIVTALVAVMLLPWGSIVVAEQGAGECCRNGYKTWRDKKFWEAGLYFKDCWCGSHEDQIPLLTCSCEGVIGGGGGTAQ